MDIDSGLENSSIDTLLLCVLHGSQVAIEVVNLLADTAENVRIQGSALCGCASGGERM